MARTSNIEKKLSGGGPNTPPLDMSEFIKLADADKYEFDALNERLELLNEASKKTNLDGVVVMKSNGKDPLVVINLDLFLDLIK